jgi:hypothetical protein
MHFGFVTPHEPGLTLCTPVPLLASEGCFSAISGYKGQMSAVQLVHTVLSQYWSWYEKRLAELEPQPPGKDTLTDFARSGVDKCRSAAQAKPAKTRILSERSANVGVCTVELADVAPDSVTDTAPGSVEVRCTCEGPRVLGWPCEHFFQWEKASAESGKSTLVRDPADCAFDLLCVSG